MTDPGLNNRLRQRSRRAGVLVGVTMGVTIAICVGGFAVVYAILAPYLSDVLPAPRPAARAAPTRIAVVEAAQVEEAPAPAALAVAAAPATEAPATEPTATAAAFQPTHQIQLAAPQSINLRPQPSSDNSAENQPIRALAPATELQYLDEDAPATNPNDAPRWMRFRTQDGQEGWVREVDIEAYQP